MDSSSSHERQPVAEGNPYQSPNPAHFDNDPDSTLSDSAKIRRHYLATETAIKSLARVYLLFGILTTTGGGAALIGVHGPGFVEMGALVTGIGLLLLTVSFGLLRLRPWGRIAGMVLSVPLLAGFPIGTLVSGYLLMLLVRKSGVMVFTPAYRQIIAETPEIRYKTRKEDWIAIAVILVVVIGILALIV